MADFKKYYIISAQPEEVFAGLTFKPTIELWTGSPAVFTLEEGAEFSMWDGSIVGKILSFERGKLMKQEWFFGELSEPSVVTMKFHPHKRGTSLEVVHTNIPDADYEDIVDGWNEVYMKDLMEFYEE
ncbi:MAG: SRPBCC domain-containing protein [Cyclobacteriaceae bacterium]